MITLISPHPNYCRKHPMRNIRSGPLAPLDRIWLKSTRRLLYQLQTPSIIAYTQYPIIHHHHQKILYLICQSGPVQALLLGTSLYAHDVLQRTLGLSESHFTYAGNFPSNFGTGLALFYFIYAHRPHFQTDNLNLYAAYIMPMLIFCKAYALYVGACRTP